MPESHAVYLFTTRGLWVLPQNTRCQKEQELLLSVSLLYLNKPFKHPSSVVFLMLSGPLLPYTSHVQHFYTQIFCKQMGYQIHYVSNKISQRCILLYILKFLLVRISCCMILLMTEILHQLIVYLIFYRVLYIPRGFHTDFWTINRIRLFGSPGRDCAFQFGGGRGS